MMFVSKTYELEWKQKKRTNNPWTLFLCSLYSSSTIIINSSVSFIRIIMNKSSNTVGIKSTQMVCLFVCIKLTVQYVNVTTWNSGWAIIKNVDFSAYPFRLKLQIIARKRWSYSQQNSASFISNITQIYFSHESIDLIFFCYRSLS